MSLLEFVKNVGDRLFETDAEAAENIRNHLDIKLTGLTNLGVGYDDGVATLSGDAESQTVRAKAILIAGNVDGVETVVADDLRAPDPKAAEPEPKEEFYTIVSGDTLGAIAKRYYGSAHEYTRIFAANREVISDPDKIYPGQKIRIPLD